MHVFYTACCRDLQPKHLLFCSEGLQLCLMITPDQMSNPTLMILCVISWCRDLQPKHLLFCSEGLAWKLIDFSTTVTANCMVVPEVCVCFGGLKAAERRACLE
jgi:hypothetical protein